MLGGQQEEGCRVVYLVQREHHQSYLWHHYQNEIIQDRHINSVQDGTKCRSPIFCVDKDMVEKSHTTLYSICKEYLNHPLGFTLSTPSLVFFYFVRIINIETRHTTAITCFQ